MITKTAYGLSMICDTCGEEHEAETSAYAQLSLSARREGWKVVPGMKNSFYHFCPDCKEYE